jgi:hypothetical protein
LNDLKDKDLQLNEADAVRTAIENARNAAMKIGQSMNQGGSSSSSSSSSSESSSS